MFSRSLCSYINPTKSLSAQWQLNHSYYIFVTTTSDRPLTTTLPTHSHSNHINHHYFLIITTSVSQHTHHIFSITAYPSHLLHHSFSITSSPNFTSPHTITTTSASPRDTKLLHSSPSSPQPQLHHATLSCYTPRRHHHRQILSTIQKTALL